MYCKECGNEVAPDQAFCNKCGAALWHESDPEPEEKAQQPRRHETSQPQPSKNCPRCGSPVRERSAFCLKCGEPLQAGQADAANARNATSGEAGVAKDFVIPIAGGIACGLVFAIVLMLVVLPAAGIPAGGTQEQRQSATSATVSSSSSEKAEDKAIASAQGGDSSTASSSAASSSAALNGASSQKKEPELEQKAPPIFTDAQASSELPPDQYTSYYGPLNVIDGNAITAWNEGSDGDGTGEWVELTAGGPQVVRGIRVMTGYAKKEDTYYKNNRPTTVTVTLSDGYSLQANLNDAFSTWSDVPFDKLHQTNSIRITVDSVASGNKYNDAAISEVEAY